MSIHLFILTVLLSSLILSPLGAEVYKLSVPHYQVKPGDTVKVPISLDNVTNLAQIRIQLNYDPQVLDFVNASALDLGQHFDFSLEINEGTVTIDFTRAETMSSGSGHLALLEFQANPGATVDLYSDLAIAQFKLGDASGVRDITAGSSCLTTNGSVSVSLSQNIDNAQNGIPDWWEKQYGLNLLRQKAWLQDDDQDGLNNIFEYHLGGNPLLHDIATHGPRHGLSPDRQHQTLTYQQRKGTTPDSISVWESEDLQTWWKLDNHAQLLNGVEDLGNGFERVTIQGLSPIQGNNKTGRGFLRLQTTPPE